MTKPDEQALSIEDRLAEIEAGVGALADCLVTLGPSVVRTIREDTFLHRAVLAHRARVETERRALVEEQRRQRVQAEEARKAKVSII